MVKWLRRRVLSAESWVRSPLELLIGFIPITGIKPFLYPNADISTFVATLQAWLNLFKSGQIMLKNGTSGTKLVR